jgi:hypothetical protein
MKRVLNSIAYRYQRFLSNLKSRRRFKELKKRAGEFRVDNKFPVALFYFKDRSQIKYSFAYYYPIMVGFVRNGYDVLLFASADDHPYFFEYNSLLFETKGIYVVDQGVAHSVHVNILFSDSEAPNFIHTDRTIFYDADVLGLELDKSSELVAPFFAHPQHLNRSIPVNANQRNITVFFSGNTDHEAYSQFSLFPMMNRIQILDVVKSNFRTESLKVDWKRESKQQKGVVIQDWQWNARDGGDTSSRIPTEQWLDLLSYCDFFLATPGSNIPHSHNLVEAMSLGSIPITNYGHLLSEPLVHRENALLFETEEELKQVIKLALDMSEDEKKRMHQNCITYYKRSLIPEVFVQGLIENKNISVLKYYGTTVSENKMRNRVKSEGQIV